MLQPALGTTQSLPEGGTASSPPSLQQIPNLPDPSPSPRARWGWDSGGDGGMLLAPSLWFINTNARPPAKVPEPLGWILPSSFPGVPAPSTTSPSPRHPKDTEDDAPEAGREGHAGVALPCHGEVREGVCRGRRGDLGGCQQDGGVPGRHRDAAEPSPPMLLPQASSVKPSTVLLSWKMIPRVRRMFTSSVAAALIHMALAKKPRKANTCQAEG